MSCLPHATGKLVQFMIHCIHSVNSNSSYYSCFVIAIIIIIIVIEGDDDDERKVTTIQDTQIF